MLYISQEYTDVQKKKKASFASGGNWVGNKLLFRFFWKTK